MDLIKNLRTKPPTYEDAVAAADEIERLRENHDVLLKVMEETTRERTDYYIGELIEAGEENRKLRQALLKIKQESNEDHIRVWAHQALQQKDIE